jgi:hypothetical protein
MIRALYVNIRRAVIQIFHRLMHFLVKHQNILENCLVSCSFFGEELTSSKAEHG